jgi:hypothetical protein
MDEARLVFVDGVFPTDVTSHLAQLQQVSGASTSDDGGERAKVVAIVARHQHFEALPADLPYLPSLAAHLRELDLSLNRLTELPAALSCLERLEYLNLGHNAFAQVPALVLTSAQATTGGGGLRHLFLGGNRLTSLPAELARLTRLENLSLGHNQFDSVPPVVYALTSLLSLSLNHNAIAAVDDGNDDGRSFARLSRLRTLDLSHNALTELALDLPRSLTSLDVSANTGLTTLALTPQLLSAKECKPAKLKRLDGWRGLAGWRGLTTPTTRGTTPTPTCAPVRCPRPCSPGCASAALLYLRSTPAHRWPFRPTPSHWALRSTYLPSPHCKCARSTDRVSCRACGVCVWRRPLRTGTRCWVGG